MRKGKTMTALLLVCLLALTACAPAANESGTSAATAPTSAGTTTSTASTASPPAIEEPGEFTMFYQEAGQNFPEGFKHNDNDYLNAICELANVKITELIVPAYSDTTTKFNLMMSSGNIPDLVERADSVAMKDYGRQGAFMPTEELIRNSPVLSKVYDDVQLQAMQSADGVSYVIQIPPLNDDYGSLWVRKDLLDELGLPVPTTIEEMTEAGRRLKEKYPDSLPFEGPGLSWRSNWLVDPFNTAFSGWKYFPEAGKVENVYAGDNIVKSVTWARQLYQEKLLDQEFMTTNTDDDNQKRVTKKTLIYDMNTGSAPLWIQRLYTAGETKAVIIPIVNPIADGVGIDAPYFAPGVVGSYTFGINAQTKNLDAVLRFLETLYSDEVRDLSIYGREGIEYKVENGEKLPILPAAADNNWRSVYGWVFINNADMLSFGRKSTIYASPNLTDEEKLNVAKTIDEADQQVRSAIYGKVGYDPLGLAQPIPDEQLNRANEAAEAQMSLYAKALMGEITIEQFIAEKDELVTKYQDVTDAYNKVVEEAKAKYGL